MSIIVPAHNDGKYLKGLVDSLREYVEFEYELIVVNNGSTDDTASILSELGITSIAIADKCYPSAARNVGIQHAAYDLIVFLDADILVTKKWADAVASVITKRSIADDKFLMGDSYGMSLQPGFLEKAWFEPLARCEKQYLNGGNILTNKNTMSAIAGFDEKLETGEDVDLSDRVRSVGGAILFNKDMYVHHEGFPKDIANFYRRERWHGKGDFSSLRHFMQSKVARLAFVFGMLFISTSLFLVFFILSGSAIYLASSVFALILQALICLVSSMVKFKGVSWSVRISSLLIFFVYFTARIHAGFNMLLRR